MKNLPFVLLNTRGKITKSHPEEMEQPKLGSPSLNEGRKIKGPHDTNDHIAASRVVVYSISPPAQVHQSINKSVSSSVASIYCQVCKKPLYGYTAALTMSPWWKMMDKIDSSRKHKTFLTEQLLLFCCGRASLPTLPPNCAEVLGTIFDTKHKRR